MIDDGIIRKLSGLGEVKTGENLSRYTTFRAGGPADVLFTPADPLCLGEVRALAKSGGVPFTVIGGGSNLLVSDSGVRGIVARVCAVEGTPGMIRMEDDGDCLLYADARVDKKDFIAFALARGFEGMEFMAGLPGCIGGGIAMNAGTGMGWFSDILVRVRYIDGHDEPVEKEITAEMARYRDLAVEPDAIFLGGNFRLKRAADTEEVRARIDDIIRDRGEKHPLEFPSAGSVFKNPEGHSSWKLVNDAGLRGFRIGGAMVSEKHTNFIVNAGGATAADIARLIRHVQWIVNEQFGVALEPEVRMLGEF
jgi:UDP-N-acetylmuramate dehydrogenase